MTYFANAFKRALAAWRVRTTHPCNRSVPVEFPVQAMGLRFANPIGLAAGFDRDGRLLKALSRCGFGFIEVGTVIAGRHHGAASMATVVGRLQRARAEELCSRIGVNIGSTEDGFGAQVSTDYASAMQAFWPVADYLVVNLTSPRNPRRGRLDPSACAELLFTLTRHREILTRLGGRRVPLAVKLDLEGVSPRLIDILKAVRIDGVVAVSSDIEVLGSLVAACHPIAIVSVGGVGTAADASARLACGAALVQVYRAFVAGAPTLAHRIVAELRQGRMTAADGR